MKDARMLKIMNDRKNKIKELREQLRLEELNNLDKKKEDKKSDELSVKQEKLGIYQRFVLWLFYSNQMKAEDKKLERQEYTQSVLTDHGVEPEQGVFLKDQGVVLTNIDIPFGRVIWLCFQVIIAMNIIMIPIALFYWTFLIKFFQSIL